VFIDLFTFKALPAPLVNLGGTKKGEAERLYGKNKGDPRKGKAEGYGKNQGEPFVRSFAHIPQMNMRRIANSQKTHALRVKQGRQE